MGPPHSEIKWLAKQGKVEESKVALQKLRKGDSSMEADSILAESQQESWPPYPLTLAWV